MDGFLRVQTVKVFLKTMCPIFYIAFFSIKINNICHIDSLCSLFRQIVYVLSVWHAFHIVPCDFYVLYVHCRQNFFRGDSAKVLWQRTKENSENEEATLKQFLELNNELFRCSNSKKECICDKFVIKFYFLPMQIIICLSFLA